VSVAEVNGARLAYDVGGSGPPLVLVPASSCDRRLWREQVPVLERDFTVVRVDQRGHGASSLPSGPFAYRDDLRGLLDHLGLDRAALAGASLGGRACLELAVTHPERVTHLVTFGVGLPDWDWSPQVRGFQGTEAELEKRGALDEAIELALDFWVEGPRRDRAVPAQVRELVRTMSVDSASIPEPEPPAAELPLEPPASTRLGTVRARTLVVVGDEDTDDMQRIADVLAAGIPGARKVLLRDTAHMSPLERPAEVTRLLVDFLHT
jgi:pimeloyl-ACP methyl ester carboxylesterase